MSCWGEYYHDCQIVILELNPRGQVAPQVHVSTATPPMRPRGEGGAAVATWGECNDLGKMAWKWSASPTETGSSSRFWMIFFLKIGMVSVQNRSKKCAAERAQTDTQTDRIQPDFWRILDSRNADTARKSVEIWTHFSFLCMGAQSVEKKRQGLWLLVGAYSRSDSECAHSICGMFLTNKNVQVRRKRPTGRRARLV